MNYETITDAVTALFNKEFTEFSDYMPTAVELAEQTIFNSVPMLACYKSTYTPQADLTQNDDGEITIGSEQPGRAGLEIVRSVRVAVKDQVEVDMNGMETSVFGPFKVIEKRPDEVVEMFRANQTDNSKPKYWYVKERSASGIKIQLGPVGEDDIKVEVRGFGLTETLDSSSKTSTTWISTFAPDALIYTTAQHMAVFLKYADMAMMYQEQAQMALMPIAQQEGLQVNTPVDKGLPDGEAA